MTLMLNNMKKQPIQLKRNNINPFSYMIIRKIDTNEIMETHKIDTKTGKKEMTFQHPEYKKVMDKIKLEQI